jgi:hypothetical protein
MHQAYTTDLTPDQWDPLASLLPPPKSTGRPRQVNLCQILQKTLLPLLCLLLSRGLEVNAVMTGSGRSLYQAPFSNVPSSTASALFCPKSLIGHHQMQLQDVESWLSMKPCLGYPGKIKPSGF